LSSLKAGANASIKIHQTGDFGENFDAFKLNQKKKKGKKSILMSQQNKLFIKIITLWCLIEGGLE